jgi:hypothetical protein
MFLVEGVNLLKISVLSQKFSIFSPFFILLGQVYDRNLEPEDFFWTEIKYKRKK